MGIASILLACTPLTGITPALADGATTPPNDNLTELGAPPNRQLTITAVKLDQLPSYITQVPGMGAQFIEASAPASKLVYTYTINGKLALLPLDTKGLPVANAKATLFVLPANGLASKYEDRILSIACHPTRPILYLWRDIGGNEGRIIPPSKEFENYDHLLVFDISQAQPKLLLSTCRGKDFMIGRENGTLSLDPTGKRLFVPNLNYKMGNTRGAAMGFYDIDSNGMPILTGSDPEELAATDLPGANVPAANASDADEDDLAGRGSGLTMLPLSQLTNRSATSEAFYVDNDHTLIYYSHYLIGSNSANRAGRLSVLTIPALSARTGSVTADTALRHAYIGHLNGNTVQVWGISDGYPSLVPQRGDIPGIAIRRSSALMESRHQLALGLGTGVLLVELDKQGWLTDKAVRFDIKAVNTSTLTYNPKFERLYVTTDAPLETTP